MTAERLGAIDAAYLAAEERRAPLHVASLAIFEAGPLTDEQGVLRLEELRARIDARLDRLPRMRQKLMFVPFGIARPVWVDDESFDVANHVDVVRVPAPGDDGALMRLVEDTIMEPLDRTVPLWHLRFVTGLTGNRVGLIERAHHAMVDGVSGVDISMVLLDLTADEPATEPSPWAPEPAPSLPSLLSGGFVDRVRAPVDAVIHAARSSWDPRIALARVEAVRSTIGALRRTGIRAPASSINRPIGSRRKVSFVRVPFADVHTAGELEDATVNDVVLTAVASGLRALLLSRGESLPPDHAITALVPVSVRGADESMALGNRVGAYFVPLPTGMGDDGERLRETSVRTKALKQSPEAHAADGLLRLADVLPPWMTDLLGRQVRRQPFVNMVVTNVPGPPFPLYAMGARMLEAVPIVPLGGNMTLEVAVLSYDGTLTVSVTSDVATCPDVDAFVRGIEHGFAQLGVGWTPALRTAVR
jgi:diacylglycerol O-acyltransferase